MSTTRRLLLALLATATLLSAGCFHFKKSGAKPNLGPAAEVEAEFKVRWVERRATELVAQGQNAEAARAQATAEFKERFGFTGAAQK
jgi:hypothetical protein